MTNPNQDGEAITAVSPAGDTEESTTVLIPEYESDEDSDDNLSRRQKAALAKKQLEERLAELEKQNQVLLRSKQEADELKSKQSAMAKFGVTAGDLEAHKEKYDGILESYTSSGTNKISAIEFAIRDLGMQNNSYQISGSTLPPRGNPVNPPKGDTKTYTQAQADKLASAATIEGKEFRKLQKQGKIRIV